MPDRAEIEAVREVIIAATDCVPNGNEGFVGWSQVLAERIVAALDRARDARDDDGPEPEPDALGGLPPSQPKEDKR